MTHLATHPVQTLDEFLCRKVFVWFFDRRDLYGMENFILLIYKNRIYHKDINTFNRESFPEKLYFCKNWSFLFSRWKFEIFVKWFAYKYSGILQILAIFARIWPYFRKHVRVVQFHIIGLLDALWFIFKVGSQIVRFLELHFQNACACTEREKNRRFLISMFWAAGLTPES